MTDPKTDAEWEAILKELDNDPEWEAVAERYRPKIAFLERLFSRE